MESRYGSLKIMHHPEKLQSLLDKKTTAPVYVRVKPNNVCNHHCTYCYFGEGNENNVSENFIFKDQIPRNKMMEILDDFKDIGVKAVTYSGGGDPLIYHSIIETLHKTLENGIDLSMITNGQRLDGERVELLSHAKWVRISLDSNNAKLFADTRKVPEVWFDELLGKIENFAQKKDSTCELGINYVVHNGNAMDVYDSIKLFRGLGVNHIKLTPMWDKEGFKEYHANTKESVLTQIARAREEFLGNGFLIYDTYGVDFDTAGVCNRTYSRCHMMQILPVIGADSKVYHCHDKAYDPTGCLGSIKNQSFKELWFSEETARRFQEFDPRESCKHYCTSDSKNIILEDTLNSAGDHVNFV